MMAYPRQSKSAARRAAATLVSVLVSFAPLAPARAAPPEPAPETEAAASEAPDESWAEAEALFRRGSARFAAADYAGAIEDFQAALELAMSADFDPAVELGLLVNLARAHKRAYKVDEDPKHLRAAQEIYRRLQRTVSLETAEAKDAVAEAEREIPLLEAQLQALAGPVDEPKPEAVPEPEPKAAPGRGLRIGGYTTLGIGVAGLALMAVGLGMGGAAKADGVALSEAADWTEAERDAIDGRGQSANTLAIIGGAVGGAALITGAVLVALGISKKKRAGSASARVTPTLGWGWVGLNAELHF